MKALDRFVLALCRRFCRRDREVSLPVPSWEQGGYRPSEVLDLGHTAAHSALTRRRGRPVAMVAATVVAVVIPAVAFMAGMEHAAGQGEDRVREVGVIRLQEAGERQAVRDTRDVCLAEAETRAGGSYWAGQMAVLRGDPRLAACYAEEVADATRVRAEVEGGSR